MVRATFLYLTALMAMSPQPSASSNDKLAPLRLPWRPIRPVVPANLPFTPLPPCLPL
jgi:hypothetical protein